MTSNFKSPNHLTVIFLIYSTFSIINFSMFISSFTHNLFLLASKYILSNSIHINCLFNCLHASPVLQTHIKGSKTISHSSDEISIKCFKILIGFCVGCKVFQFKSLILSHHIQIQLSIKLCICA